MLGLAATCRAEPRAGYARGVLEELRGNGAAAELAFVEALEEDPDAWPVLLKVAGYRWAAKDLEGASTLYREFAHAHPERLEAQFAYADFLRDSTPGDDFAAKLGCEVLETSLEKHPDNLEVILRLFRFYEQRGMRDRSLALYERVGGRDGAALATAEMARTLFPSDDEKQRGKLDVVLERAFEAAPEDPVVARRASEHFRKTGRLEKAIEILARHTEADPSSLELRIRQGILLLAAKREDEGEESLEEVLVIDPNQALAHQTLAKLFRRQERFDEARPHAAELLKLRGGSADDFKELADEFLVAEMAREARLLLEKGLFEHPDDGEIAAQLAVATRRDPETRDQAVRLFREAESVSGKQGPASEPEFLREFAECLLEADQVAAAEERLRMAIRAYPAEAKKETAAALRRLAGIWTEAGRNEAAAKALLDRAEALDP